MVNDTQLPAQPPLKRAKQDATPTDAQFQHRAWWPAPLPGNDGDLLPRYLYRKRYCLSVSFRYQFSVQALPKDHCLSDSFKYNILACLMNVPPINTA